MKAIIINADDFGLTDGVNAAILDAYQAGCVSSTTLLVNGAAASAAAQLARAHPGLGVGLHFNLTLGRPSAPPGSVPSLLDADGCFVSRPQLARRVLLRRLRRAEVAREVQAQLDAFRQLGLQPTHVDSHQHVHGFPPVFDELARACVAHDLPLRQPWVAVPAGARASLGRRLRTALLALMNQRNQRAWRGRLRSNAAFASVFDLGQMPAELSLADYRRLLLDVQAFPLELMVHLVRDAADVNGLTRIGDVAQAEWRCARDGVLARLIAEQGMSLHTYASAFAAAEA